MAGWIIFLTIPIVIGGIVAFIKLLVKKTVPLVGSQNQITSLYDKEGELFSIQNLSGNVVILQAWSNLNQLENDSRRLKNFLNLAIQYNSKLKCFLVYVDENELKDIPRANSILEKYSLPLLLDKDGVFPRFFGKEYSLWSLILDERGIIRSIPHDRLTGFDKTILKKIFTQKKSN